ncbi:OmpW/AlkL family protein, partial [Acinetobacter sp. MD2(2019)]|uniref:OmpW/AlkL family protein n=1 Tax=Acinetobacter sp. MD2(2019) TaxID=2605273 RepID=UPI002D1EF0D0
MLKKILVVSLLAASSATFAGNWQVKVGGSVVAPSKNDNTLLNGALTNVKASNEYAFTPSVEYFFGDSGLSTELLLATPLKHDVTASGEKIASFKQLPPTLTLKYNFKNSTGFTPYVGVGATAVIIWGEKIDGAKLKADDSFGVAGQVGFNFKPADAKNWGVFADVRYADVSSDLKLNGAK